MNSITAEIPKAKPGRTSKAKRWHRSLSVPAGAREVVIPLLKELRAQRAELADLKNRLAQMEANQKSQGNAYHVPQSLTEFKPRRQPPAGMTAMQAIMGKLDVEETTEELLAQLKAMG